MKTAMKVFLFAMLALSFLLPIEQFVKGWVLIGAMYFINLDHVVLNIAKNTAPKPSEAERQD